MILERQTFPCVFQDIDKMGWYVDRLRKKWVEKHK